jgi:hypothetical protein
MELLTIHGEDIGEPRVSGLGPKTWDQRIDTGDAADADPDRTLTADRFDGVDQPSPWTFVGGAGGAAVHRLITVDQTTPAASRPGDANWAGELSALLDALYSYSLETSAPGLADEIGSRSWPAKTGSRFI